MLLQTLNLQVFLQGDRAAAAALSGALEGVLRHVGWKAGLTERLLAAVDTARERQKGMDDALRQLSQCAPPAKLLNILQSLGGLAAKTWIASA